MAPGADAGTGSAPGFGVAVGAARRPWRTPRAALGRPRKGAETGTVLVASAVLFAAAAIVLGQDIGWDTLNYHVYNPYAWLEGRLHHDLQPAMRQTYFNPLLDVPFFLLNQALPTFAAAAAWAAVQGLLLAVVYALARVLLGDLPRRHAIPAAALLALVGAAAPFNVAQIGRFTGDNTSGLFVLAALWIMALAVRGPEGLLERRRVTLALIAGAGLLAGVGFGLKPTNGPYALALPLAFMILPLSARLRAQGLALYGAGGLAGALGSAGHWWWRLWTETGNPLFPQLNHVFRSPWIHPLSFADGDYRAGGWMETLLYPAYYNEALTGRTILWQSFGDVRLPMVLGIGLLVLLAWAWSRVGRRPARSSSSGRGAPGSRPHRLVLGFFLGGYVLWLAVFSIARYTLVLEVLAPVAVYAGLRLLRLPGRPLLLSTSAAVLLIVLSYRHMDGDRAHFGATPFDVQAPPDVVLEGALVVIASETPLAFVIPWLDRSARFVHVSGNLFYPGGYSDVASRYANRMGQELLDAILNHEGPRYVMTTPAELEPAAETVLFFGLGFDPAGARRIRARIGQPILLIEAESR
jgi:hypothetical protein